MSAEILRRAAELMRERAEAADDGHAWVAVGSHVDTDPECGFDAGTSLLSEHIASWHPAVALAVADLLDKAAEMDDLARKFTKRGFSEDDLIVAVARAYLGEPA